MLTDSPWLNMEAAEEYTDRGRRYLRKQVDDGRLRSAVIGGKRELMFRREWLDEWLESLSRPVEVFPRRRA